MNYPNEGLLGRKRKKTVIGPTRDGMSQNSLDFRRGNCSCYKRLLGLEIEWENVQTLQLFDVKER